MGHEFLHSGVIADVYDLLPKAFRVELCKGISGRGNSYVPPIDRLNAIWKWLPEEVDRINAGLQFSEARGPDSAQSSSSKSGQKSQSKRVNNINAKGHPKGGLKQAPKSNSQPGKPEFKTCKDCKRKHSHLYYCEKFRNTLVKDRHTICRSNNVCFKCLRMDSQVDHTNLAQWRIDHQTKCDSDWLCEEDGCDTKPDNSRLNSLYKIKCF